MSDQSAKQSRGLPAHGWVGLALVATMWPLNWLLPGERTNYLFFPLWLGYILVVDAWVRRRTGDSLWTRSRHDFALLFVASAPAWWFFELLNLRLQNWIYIPGGTFTSVKNFVLSTICFSTVIPAVFETAELLGTTRWIQRFGARQKLSPSRSGLWAMAGLGAAMLALLLVWPRYFFPLVWLSLIFLLEPAAAALGRRGLLSHLRVGDWRPLATLALGALLCGFFWELWNIHSYPKWIYDVPFVGFAKVFEMPLLGYGGYLPFGLELYPMAHLILRRPPDLRLAG